jgi:hypothetical protein
VWILDFLLVALHVALFIVFISGWERWVRRARIQIPVSKLSFMGFLLGTASALLAIGSALYAITIGGFGYREARLLKILAIGLLLSLAGLVLSICGIWRKSILRWHAPFLSFGMSLLWLVWTTGE